MTYWIKINYDRNTYVIDLERIGAFCRWPNGKLSFSLPDGCFPIFIHAQTDPDTYQVVSNYLSKIVSVNNYQYGYWVKIDYDRNEYIINLNCVSAFCRQPSSGRISFWLPNGDKQPIILNPQTDQESYHLVEDYIQQKTGFSWD